MVPLSSPDGFPVASEWFPSLAACGWEKGGGGDSILRQRSRPAWPAPENGGGGVTRGVDKKEPCNNANIIIS